MLQPLVEAVLRKGARHHRSKPFAMRNAAPLVSFTFDDVPASAYVNGAAILEQCGVRGTFYIAAGTCGIIDLNEHWRVIDRHQVSALHDRGHEIGCHTFSHVKVDQVDARTLDEDCRGIYEGINAGVVDLALLRVIELYDRTLTPEKLRRVLRETKERNGWLVFYSHDVADPPSWIGSSPALLREVVAAVQAENIECLTIREALAAIGYRRPAAIRDVRLRAVNGAR